MVCETKLRFFSSFLLLCFIFDVFIFCLCLKRWIIEKAPNYRSIPLRLKCFFGILEIVSNKLMGRVLHTEVFFLSEIWMNSIEMNSTWARRCCENRILTHYRCHLFKWIFVHIFDRWLACRIVTFSTFHKIGNDNTYNSFNEIQQTKILWAKNANLHMIQACLRTKAIINCPSNWQTLYHKQNHFSC